MEYSIAIDVGTVGNGCTILGRANLDQLRIKSCPLAIGSTMTKRKKIVFKKGDYVVIAKIVDGTHWPWVHQMNKLIGCPGIIVETRHEDGETFHSVITYVDEENGGFMYRTDALRRATKKEMRTIKFIHGVRRTR